MILSASGGLVYHARAAFSFTSWEGTRRPVSTLVSNWLKLARPNRLIIFGPSGGYLLERQLFSTVFSKRFSGVEKPLELVVVDPDPLASLIFRRRFSKTECTWVSRADLLPFTSADPTGFSKFIAEQSKSAVDAPRLAVLFFGVLGQIELHPENLKRPKSDASRLLLESLSASAVSWASLHDLESAEVSPGLSELPIALNECAMNSLLRIKETNTLLENLNLKVSAWTDHETEWLGCPQAVVPWLLSRRRLHMLGWTSFVGTD